MSEGGGIDLSLLTSGRDPLGKTGGAVCLSQKARHNLRLVVARRGSTG